MADKILTFNGKSILGPSGTGMVIIDIPDLPEPAANTLRFDFGDKNYDPTVAGVGTSGTWTKLSHPFNNIWDWTNTNTSWATAFGGGSATNPGAFADYENNPVKVIAAGDTSSVTDFSRFFQNCYAITEVCPIDTSNATTVLLMFSHCENCSKFPDIDFSSATASNGTAGVYQCCYKMKKGPSIVFPSDHSFSLQNFFMGCHNLEEVPLYNTSQCTNMNAMFSAQYPSTGSLHSNDIMRLKSVPLFDTSNVTNMQQMFSDCTYLTSIPDFNTSKVTSMDRMFNITFEDYKMHINKVPDFDYSACKSFNRFMSTNVCITEIPEMNIEASVTNVGNMFKNCPNVKSGQKALYDKLSAISTITNHKDCFKDCGINTLEGHYQLNQVPITWGGLQDPNHTVTIYGRTYRTVTIGNTEWMAENLEADFPNGINPYYNNDPSMKDKGYGRLYEWETIINNHRHDFNSNIPQGWRLPTTAEINELVNYFGNNASTYSNARSNIGWTLAETQGNDSNGLFILPAGVGNVSDGSGTTIDENLEETALLWYEDREEWSFDWNQMSFNFFEDGTFDPECYWSNSIYCSVRLVKTISSN